MRSESSLIQTIGRAARNVDGMVIMYANTVTASMERAISETQRRRTLQDKFNKEHGITPQSVQKDIRKVIESFEAAEDETIAEETPAAVMIENLRDEMLAAAENLEFERAAELRDRIKKLQEK